MSRQRKLAMEQLPPLWLPASYFAVAPWFGIAFGVGLCFAPQFFASRWMPQTLALTHVLVLGCLTMIMLGALVQVLPVLSAAAVPKAERLAPAIQVALVAGTVALAIGLWFGHRPVFMLAGTLLLVAFGLYLLPLGSVLVRRIGGGESLFGIRLAALALLVTVGLGLLLVTGHVAPERVPGYRGYTDWHAGFGLAGWASLLIMAVSFQVLPMFHVAKDYPVGLTRGLPIAAFAGLAVGVPWFVGLVLAVYAVATLAVLQTRKRKAPDATVRFWQLGMAGLLAALAVAWLRPQQPVLLGVLFLFGFVLSVVIGMLYKIVPFLSFTHLQRACLTTPSRVVELPSMNEIVSLRTGRLQLGLHAAATLLLAAAAWLPDLAGLRVTAGVAVVGDFVRLAWTLRSGFRRFAVVRDRWAAADAAAARTAVDPAAPG